MSCGFSKLSEVTKLTIESAPPPKRTPGGGGGGGGGFLLTLSLGCKDCHEVEPPPT